jgi:hypothetical protein
MKVSYAESELLATEFSEFLESKGILVKVNELGWKLNYTEFATVKPGDPF